MFLTKADLAKQLNVSGAAVDVWVKRGLRADARGRFDRERAFKWICENIQPQVSASGVSRGATRAAELLGRSKPGNHSNGGNGHDGTLNPAQERARRDRALSERIELQNEISKGALVRVNDVAAQVAAEYSIIRNRLLSLPAKIAPACVVVAGEGAQAVRQVLEREIREVLVELSRDAEDEA
jgi:hypothetical protein